MTFVRITCRDYQRSLPVSALRKFRTKLRELGYSADIGHCSRIFEGVLDSNITLTSAPPHVVDRIVKELFIVYDLCVTIWDGAEYLPKDREEKT